MIVALLILGANWLLNQNGESLPNEITDAAESIVAESMAETALDEAAQADEAPVAAGEPAVSTHSGQDNATTDTAMPWANADGDFDYYVLALSWQPAFCETQSGKPECNSQDKRPF